MKLLRNTAFILYRYYDSGSVVNKIPYFRTLCTLTLFLFLHLMQALLFFDKMDILPLIPSDARGTNRIFIFLMAIPVYLILRWLIKVKELEEINEAQAYNWDKVFKWNTWLIIYVILSIGLLGFLAFWRSAN